MSGLFCTILGTVMLMAGSTEDGWPFPTLSGQPPIVIAHRGAICPSIRWKLTLWRWRKGWISSSPIS